MSFAFHIPQPFPAFSRAERIPVWAQLLYKQKVAGIFFTGRSKLLDVSCFITTVCQISPSKTCRDLPPAPCAVGRRAGSCCGAADFKQCVSVAGGEQLPAGFPEQMSWLVRASFSDKICTVWRTSRQLVNLSKLMEKHNPCTS